MKNNTVAYAVAVLVLQIFSVDMHAEGPGKPDAAQTLDGKSFDKEGYPTYKIAADGTVDWYTYSGFRRYHSECHVWHGPNFYGASLAPGVKESVKRITHTDFLGVVASGRKNVTTSQENVMPAFGANANVMCYVDDIYIYLRARSDEAVGRVRPAKHEDKPEAYAKAEEACMGK